MRLEFTTLLRQKKPGYDNKVVKEIKETKNNCILIKVRTEFHLPVKFGFSCIVITNKCLNFISGI